MIDLKELKGLASSLNILYAEDEDIIRDGMSDTLKKFFKNVYLAKNGQEAMQIYKKENIDLVLTDINMPIMDGMELISEIHKIDANPIIIVISAYNESKLLQRLINLDINYFLNKPVEKDSLSKILFKACSIINNKKLAQKFAKDLKHENALIARKNKILEHKLNQIAAQTNKIVAQENKIKNKLETQNPEDSYYKTLYQDDIDELRELSQDLETYIMMIFQNDSIHKDYVSKLANVYSKYASVLNNYAEFYPIADSIRELSAKINSLENKFLQNTNQTGIYLESLQHTLETFRKNIIEKEAANPKFYNASLTNDIQLIINFLEGKESSGSDIEFF